MSARPKDLTDKHFERLIPKKIIGKDSRGNYIWYCECSCGNTVNVTATALITGRKKSCGCLRRENAKEKIEKAIDSTRTHGKSNTRLYHIWKDMIRRTINPNRSNYKRYGGRGIEVCSEWKTSFESFYNWSMKNGYNDTLSIDRKDNNKGYSPDNCQWTNKTEQANNKASNRKITYRGETKTVAEWSKITGIPYTKLMYRINAGWNIEKAFTE